MYRVHVQGTCTGFMLQGAEPFVVRQNFDVHRATGIARELHYHMN